MALSDRPFGPVSFGTTVPPAALNVQATSAPSQLLPVLQLIKATAETQIVAGPQSLPLSCAIPPATANEQTKFNFSASGYITTTASGNITLSLYSGVSTTIGSNTLLKASSATAQASKSAPWWIWADLIYDSVSGELGGTVQFYINRTLVAAATLANFPTGLSNLNDPVIQFSMTITSSGAGSGTPTTINVAKFTCG